MLFSVVGLQAQTKATKHYKSFANVKEIGAFFSLNSEMQTVISGHRGSVEAGLAENAIESFEEVLMHTFAFFETDPRLTKDSTIVLMHDAMLDRTTNAIGPLAAKNWNEIQSIRLKDRHGKLTDCHIPKLEDALAWCKGKTVLNLDKKDVPPRMIAELLRKLNAYSYVMLTVHTPDEALFYRSYNADQMLSVHAKSLSALQGYIDAGVEMRHMIVYIGATIQPENRLLYQKLRTLGLRAMISAAPSYDRESTISQRATAYRAIEKDGAKVIESDFPIEVSKALNSTRK